MNNRGIVLEIEDNQLIIMRSTGQIDRIPRGKRICEVGEEIVYIISPKSSIKGLIITIIGLSIALIACFFIIIKMTGAAAGDDIIAYVSIDVKPSIELGIDENEIVREIREIGKDSKEWISDIKYENQSLEDVTAAILNKAEKGSLAGREGDIVVAAAIKTENAKISDVVLANKLNEQVTKHIRDTHPNNASEFIVLSMAVPNELRTIGNVQGVSMGQYAIYLKMKSNGDHISFEKIKEQTLRQLETEVKDLVATLTANQAMSKAVLSELLQDEKAGKLDEDLSNKGSTVAPTSTKKPVSTPKPTMKPSISPSQSTKPTTTPTGSAKPTFKPSSTSKPTATPESSIKPSPSKNPDSSPKPTSTPKSTATPKPTTTLKPSSTPKPTDNPKESDEPSVG